MACDEIDGLVFELLRNRRWLTCCRAEARWSEQCWLEETVNDRKIRCCLGFFIRNWVMVHERGTEEWV